MQLTLSHISYAYPGATSPILNNVSLAFPQGWTALLGDNGCGKTTLARLACGLIKPDAGSSTQGLVCAYCAQETAAPPEALYDFAASYDRLARDLRHVLRLEDDMPWRYAALSCGEQKKLQVACALWQRPDVLALDEPTNHLDLHSAQTLEQALAAYPGALLLVSHDEPFLAACTSRRWEVRDGAVRER